MHYGLCSAPLPASHVCTRFITKYSLENLTVNKRTWFRWKHEIRKCFEIEYEVHKWIEVARLVFSDGLFQTQ